MMNDGHRDNSVGERKLIWDEENRLLSVDDNGFVSNYWYDADGERTVKTSGESDQFHAIDTHTATILSRHIELMLDYCARFYERQFIIRENKNKNVLEELEILLDDYITSGRLRDSVLPTPEYCATKLRLSVTYFNDLLKFETGKTLDGYFQLKRLEVAKKMLLKAGNTPAIVARQLGYNSAQYFSLLFKRNTGIAPNKYNCSLN